MQTEIQKNICYFEIIAFKLVALNTRFYSENILVIGCQYANKECPDFRYLRKSVCGADFL